MILACDVIVYEHEEKKKTMMGVIDPDYGAVNGLYRFSRIH